MSEATLAAYERMVDGFRGPIGKHYLTLAEAGFSGIATTIALKAANCLGLVEADGCTDELQFELNELTKKYKPYLNRKCIGMPVLLDEVCKNLDYDISKREAQALRRNVQQGRNRLHVGLCGVAVKVEATKGETQPKSIRLPPAAIAFFRARQS